MTTVADLTDARESLDYWETRSRRLPRWAVRRRREAREMAARWRRRIAAAERDAYGGGLIGALLLAATERRLPVAAAHGARRAARRGAQAVGLLVLTFAALVILAVVAFVDVLAHLL